MDNTNNKQSKRYLGIFATVSIVLLALIALFIYIIDPFFQYRTKDKRYILNPIYDNPGLAMNDDYNTVIIGSSMAQNYDLSILRKDSVTKPVKLASGSMTPLEMELMYSLVNKEKTNTVIVNIDMIQFNEWLAEYRYPEYLYKGRIQDRLRYHFAYESVVRYGLVDAVLQPYFAFTKEEDIPQKLKIRSHIDDIGNFSLEATYNDANRIKQLYKSGQTVSEPTLFQINARIKYNMDIVLNQFEFDKNPDKEFIFILPPYSALYWYITKKDDYYHHLMNNVKHLCRMTKNHKNVRIQYFYNLEQITDLNRYSDVTHFDPSTSSYMLENLRNDNYTINTKNMNEWLNKLDNTVNKFAQENADWL